MIQSKVQKDCKDRQLAMDSTYRLCGIDGPLKLSLERLRKSPENLYSAFTVGPSDYQSYLPTNHRKEKIIVKSRKTSENKPAAGFYPFEVTEAYTSDV